MKNVNRYGCGNGEGMFDDSEGYWVTHEDYKLLLDKYDKLALTIPVVSNSYCGEQGNDNMKADIKEIMHACGDKFDFIRLCNEAQEELNEAAFDLDQESRMNGV